MNKEVLVIRRDMIHKEINDLYEHFFEVEDREPLYKQIEKLNDELKDICDEIMLFEPIIASNEYVDLRRKDKYTFLIYIHNDKTIVGEINYRKYHCNEHLGDVGYSVYDKYRGNNYAYHALCALSEYLKSNDIPDFWISTYKHNIPSFRTIEKYGGKLIIEKGDFVLYECNTSRLK